MMRISAFCGAAALLLLGLASCGDRCASQVVTAVAPAYPQLALLSGTSGTVIVEVTAGEKGEALSVAVKEGHPLLHEACLDAARKWRFGADSGRRPIRLEFEFRVVPRGTPNSELTTVFRAPYRVEVRRGIPDIPPNETVQR